MSRPWFNEIEDRVAREKILAMEGLTDNQMARALLLAVYLLMREDYPDDAWKIFPFSGERRLRVIDGKAIELVLAMRFGEDDYLVPVRVTDTGKAPEYVISVGESTLGECAPTDHELANPSTTVHELAEKFADALVAHTAATHKPLPKL